MKQTGKLEELNLQPGDVVKVRWSNAARSWTISEITPEGKFLARRNKRHPWTQPVSLDRSCIWTVVHRIRDEQVAWREMDDTEKGALLLARHEGKTIERCVNDEWVSYQGSIEPDGAYRIKPEPIVAYRTMFCTSDGYEWSDICLAAHARSVDFPLVDGKIPCGEFTHKDGFTIHVSEY